MNTQTKAQDANLDKDIKLDSRPKEPSLKGFFSFLVQHRGFYPLVAATWGFMLGGSVLMLLTLVTTALLGGGKYIAAFLCCLLGGYVLVFARPALKKIYLSPGMSSRIFSGRLFAEAAKYGIIAPFYVAYLLVRVFYLKCKLVRTMNELNASALKRRHEINDLHNQVMTLREDNKKKAEALPRGDSRTTVIRLKIESLRQKIKAAGEENEAYLLNCRQQARDLGIVLREKDNIVSLPPNTTILQLLSIQIKKLATLGLNG